MVSRIQTNWSVVEKMADSNRPVCMLLGWGAAGWRGGLEPYTTRAGLECITIEWGAVG